MAPCHILAAFAAPIRASLFADRIRIAPVPLTRLRALLAALAVVLALTAGGRPAAAHPHVQVETTTRIVYDGEGRVSAIEHDWTFDDMYTSYATQGLDKNGDGQFSREELAELTKVNVEHLGQQRFFTVMKHDRRFVSFGAVRDAWSEVKNGKLVLHFTVPIATPYAAADKPVTVEIYDPDYFVAFVPADGDAATLGHAHLDHRIHRRLGVLVPRVPPHRHGGGQLQRALVGEPVLPGSSHVHHCPQPRPRAREGPRMIATGEPRADLRGPGIPPRAPGRLDG